MVFLHGAFRLLKAFLAFTVATTPKTFEVKVIQEYINSVNYVHSYVSALKVGDIAKASLN